MKCSFSFSATLWYNRFYFFWSIIDRFIMFFWSSCIALGGWGNTSHDVSEKWALRRSYARWSIIRRLFPPDISFYQRSIPFQWKIPDLFAAFFSLHIISSWKITCIFSYVWLTEWGVINTPHFRNNVLFVIMFVENCSCDWNQSWSRIFLFLTRKWTMLGHYHQNLPRLEFGKEK